MNDRIWGWAKVNSVASQLVARKERIVGERRLMRIMTTGASHTASMSEEMTGSGHNWGIL
jgi:hypothetical protein